MLDIEGLAVSSADRSLLREPAVGGVILFSRNYQDLSQLDDLVSDIRALRSPPLLIAVDHEGGRVQRFRKDFSAIPPMRRIGHEYDSDLGEALLLAKTAGWLSGSELRATGIDLSFAPCADLDWGVSEVIGDRAFHKEPEAVGDLASAFSRGLRSAGMAAIADWTSLRAVNLSGAEITDLGFKHLARSKSLRRIFFVSLRNPSSTVISFLTLGR